MGNSKREKKSKSRGKWGPEFHASLESKVLEFQQSKARDRDFVFQDVVNMLDRFLNNLSRRISTAKKQRVSQDELYVASLQGVWQACERFDPTKKTKFMTSAQKRIRGAIIDYVREQDPLTRLERIRATVIKHKRNELTSHNRIRPTIRELSDVIGLSPEQIINIYRILRHNNPLFIDERVYFGEDCHGYKDEDQFADGDHGYLWEKIPQSTEENPLEIVLAGEMRLKLDRFVRCYFTLQRLEDGRGVKGDAMDEVDRNTEIAMAYIGGKTLREAGALLGVSESRACQLVKQLRGSSYFRERLSLESGEYEVRKQSHKSPQKHPEPVEDNSKRDAA